MTCTTRMYNFCISSVDNPIPLCYLGDEKHAIHGRRRSSIGRKRRSRSSYKTLSEFRRAILSLLRQRIEEDQYVLRGKNGRSHKEIRQPAQRTEGFSQQHRHGKEKQKNRAYQEAAGAEIGFQRILFKSYITPELSDIESHWF